MSRPVRIQLSRRKGWRMPANTISIARPGKWGNPFPVGKPGPLGHVAADRAESVRLFGAMMADPELRAAAGYPEDLSELRGHNLACWCPLPKAGEPDICHGSILLGIVNR